MKFRIKHEKRGIQIVTLISIFMMFGIAFIPDPTLMRSSIVIDIVLLIGSAALYFIEQAVGTVIIIERDHIIVRHLLGRKKIAVDSITDVGIEKYQRSRKQGRYSRYTEYRMRMTIRTADGGDIVLTDTATTVNGAVGFLLSIHDRLPDEEVPLYKAYQIIRTKI